MSQEYDIYDYQKVQEFVYEQVYSDKLKDFAYIPHRVLTRAGHKMFIEKEPYDPAKHKPGDLLEWWKFKERTMSIDRYEIEGKGWTVRKGTDEHYYLKPPPQAAKAQKSEDETAG